MLLHEVFGLFCSPQVAIEGRVKAEKQMQSLKEQEGPELAVVQLADTSSDPRAVMVVPANAFATKLAVLGPVRLLDVALLTEPLVWEVYLGNETDLRF